MGQALQNHADSASGSTDSWAFRLAQRALAALLDGSRRHTNIRVADLRSSAVAALSALSVDDRGLIAGWLGLLLLNAPCGRLAQDLGTLARIDRPLAIAVNMQRPQALARFDLPGCLQAQAAGAFPAQ